MIEEDQRVERERDGHVVHDGDVQVAAVRREVAVRIPTRVEWMLE